MKGFYIFEESINQLQKKQTIACFNLGDISHIFNTKLEPNAMVSAEVEITASVGNTITRATTNEDDTYDFETGALIALMKMCGLEKVVRACNEAFPKERYNTYIAKLEGKLRDLKKDFNKVRDLKDFYKKNYEDVKEHYDKLGDRNKYLIYDNNKKLEYIKEKDEEIKRLNASICAKGILNNKLLEENKELKGNIDELFKSEQHSKSELGRLYFEKHRLEEEVEKLKLDCEKLKHGYIDTDMVFCGGRQNGKQYTALVELFKKIDQKKVDEAYKEAYEKWSKQPVWQKEVFNHINQLTVDSLIEQSRAFTRKCVDEWLYKIPTKREEKWKRILELHKENDVIIEVKKEDVTTFLHEIENRIPEITWGSGVKIFETKYTIKDVYFELKSHDVIYFRLSRATKLTYTSDPHIYPYRELKIIDYLPPMRWDLFKKGRLAVKVDYDNYKEFYEACEKELGKRPVTAVFTEDFTVSICKKDGLFEIFTIEDQKKTGRKIVDWEDVRENTFTMEDPYDTWKW